MNRVTQGLLALIAGASTRSPLTAIAQTAAKPPISSDAMAVHLRAKRATAVPSSNAEDGSASIADPVTFNSEQGPGPGPIALDRTAIYFPRHRRQVRRCRFLTSARRRRQPTRA